MVYTHVLNRGGKGVRSPADALTQGLSPSQLYYNGAIPIGISREPYEVDIVDKPVKSGENRALAPGPAGAGYTGQHTQ